MAENFDGVEGAGSRQTARRRDAKGTITRRDVLKSAAALMAGGSVSQALGASAPLEKPWAAMPAGNKPDKVVGVLWQYGKIYEDIFPRFEKDWGVKAEAIIEANVEPQVAKLTSMFAARDQVDASMAAVQYLSSFIDQGIVEPIDDLPGAQDYIKDFTPLTKEIFTYNGKTWGLPYYSAVWVFLYNQDKLKRLGVKEPFKSWDELVEQSLKAKKDGVAKYPILWVGGVGPEQLPGTWFSMTWNRGSAMFDKERKPLLGPGSVARETLAWWRKTFVDLEIADPKSLEYRWLPAAKAFSTGDYLYLGAIHHYFLSVTNDRAQSPIAGKTQVMMMPGEGKTLGYTGPYIMVSGSKNKEWAWKLLQYLGGRTKDGEFTQAKRLCTDAMLGSGFASVMSSDAVRSAWAKWGDVGLLMKQWDKAGNWLEAVSAMREPWYSKWNDSLNAILQDTLRGKLTADQACDDMVKAIDDAKRRR